MEALGSCPWLGTETDRTTSHTGPSETHLCYARRRPTGIVVEHQERFCLDCEHSSCAYYVPPPAAAEAPEELVAPAADEVGPAPARFPWLRVLLWVAALAVAAAVIYVYVPALLRPAPAATPAAPAAGAVVPATPSPTPTPTSGPLPALSPVPAALPAAVESRLPTATPTPIPGGALLALTPQGGTVGWVASDEAQGNHLADSYLYAGVWDGVIYHAVFQLDLSMLPRGALIQSAVLELTGLDSRRLGADGAWEVRILDRGADENWSRLAFQDVHNAAVRSSLLPVLAAGDLVAGEITSFVLSPEQMRELEQRVLDQHYTVSFRLDGPLAGDNSVFAWDSGFGPETRGRPPRLLLNVGPAPKTPVPTQTPLVVVVTSTPTAAHVFTAAAWVRTATAAATTTGTATPTSIYRWTATPMVVVTSTPTPASRETAEYEQEFATAVALTTGTYTPTPLNFATATATSTPVYDEREPSATPTPPAVPTPATPSAPSIPADLRGLIAFRSDRAGESYPWVMQPTGEDVAQLDAEWPYSAAAGGEALSPDGGRTVYVDRFDGHSALYIKKLGARTGRLIAVAEVGSVSAPVWSPDGNRIAFIYTTADGSELWLVNQDGAGLKQLTRAAWGDAGHPSFSPDGRRLAYAGADGTGRRQIWVIAVAGTGRENVSRSNHDDWDPVWIK